MVVYWAPQLRQGQLRYCVSEIGYFLVPTRKQAQYSPVESAELASNLGAWHSKDRSSTRSFPNSKQGLNVGERLQLGLKAS